MKEQLIGFEHDIYVEVMNGMETGMEFLILYRALRYYNTVEI